MRKVLVLLNFGGPQSLDEVEGFLKNLFTDPYIFRYPSWFRHLLAWYLTRKRLEEVKENYKFMGGKSPLVDSTKAQCDALSTMFQGSYDVYCAMRYSSPSIPEVINKLKETKPQEVLLLPLYPHFSMTTTYSSFRAWEEEARRQGFSYPTQRVCCYPRNRGYINAHSDQIQKTYASIQDKSNVRLLFSAHGIPMQFVRQGDPYVSHIKLSCAEILKSLKNKKVVFQESVLCFQSRVGPMKWTTPYLEDELKRAAKDKKDVLVVPISFVGEHSETLAELDRDYRKMAEDMGIKFYRVPALECHPSFIEGLSELVLLRSRTPSACSLENLQCWRRQ